MKKSVVGNGPRLRDLSPRTAVNGSWQSQVPYGLVYTQLPPPILIPAHLPDEKLKTPMMNFEECNQWGINPGYTSCYPFSSWDTNNCDIFARMDIDEKNSVHVKRSNRDKRILDGWASKNADYYKKNFYNELEKEEAKVWWGNNEY